MSSISITLSNAETDQDEEQARRKTLEALDDLIDELCRPPVDKAEALKAFLAAGQGLVMMIRASAHENLVCEDDIALYVREFFQKCNEAHIEKMLQRRDVH